jgi:hypothetical protein
MLSLITGWLKGSKAPPPVNANEAHQAIFRNTVERHLSNRKSVPDYMALDPVYQVPKYVIPMCQDLCRLINRSDVDLAEVLRIEKTAVGHADYQNKLALRCYLCAIRQ